MNWLRKGRIAAALAGFVCLSAQKVPQAYFREILSAESSIAWRHNNARSAMRYLPETMSGGVAIFDYNNDGWMDLLFTDTGSSSFYKAPKPAGAVLFQNDGSGSFRDVTAKAGLQLDQFSMGAAAADYDGDGCVDVFLTGYEKSTLLRNRCDGTFEDATAKSGVRPPGWSTSAAWLDYDNDGKLDLYVLQFLDYSALTVCNAATAYGGAPEAAQNDKEGVRYCSPINFRPTASHLYRNRGGGVFEDVSETTGISAPKGKGLGVVATDINNDGWMDLFHANDMVSNFLFINRGGKKFDERGIEAGVAYSADGQVRSGMGVDAADVNDDGREDLFVANIDQQTFSLYRNDGDELFTDISPQNSIARETRLLSGWGSRFFDFDNDGVLDLVLANGHPDDKVDLRLANVTYAEPLLLFRGTGKGGMRNVSRLAGPAFQRNYAARGLAVGDWNNDGFPDVVIAVNGVAPVLLQNNATAGTNNWLGLDLQPVTANPGAIGAIVRWQAGGSVRRRLVTGGGSYLSSNDPRVLLGCGSKTIDWIEIAWPSPSRVVDRIERPPLNRYLKITEGKGITSNRRGG